jgi:tetratricopeptide (TPR) repeat protein
VPDRAVITVFEGTVAASNPQGSVMVQSGDSVVAQKGMAPVPRTAIGLREAVRWALYYPPIIDPRLPASWSTGNKWKADARESLQRYRIGDLAGAFDSLANIQPDEIDDPGFFIYRAALLLTVGRVDEAAEDIDRASGLDPQNADAAALRSIVALTQGETKTALELANNAVELESQSPTAKIALSYARQGMFDIQGARESVEQAVADNPGHALAWARLSELWQSEGYLDRSLTAAKKATELNPDLARTQTVLGFAYLAKINTADAQAAYHRAIMLDQGDPLPHLGMGLALIRDGKLKEGRQRIEVAVGLDASASLNRSYLGKAYYEEKRDDLAAVQYELAKQLDPNDPTPWFYNSILLQSRNRPVDALHNQQQAIERNDRRLVYRSRLLLDKDLAARSVALGRIYNDLNIEDLSAVKATDALSIDPGNHSAHRLLADSYYGKVNVDAARQSELLQSRITQPLNLDPLQPQLNNSNLGLLDGTGPGTISYNEYNPLFTRNGFALQVDGAVAEQGTWSQDVILAGLLERFAFSLGQYHTETDGFRVNADYEQDIYSAFAQFALSTSTSLQIEIGREEEDKGDVALRLLPDLLSDPTLRVTDETTSFRAGLTHEFSPSAATRISTIQRDNEGTEITSQGELEVARDREADIDMHDFQWQQSWSGRVLLVGASYNRQRSDSLLTLNPCPPPPVCQFPTSADESQGRVYGYYFFEPAAPLRLTMGATVAQDDSELFDSEDTRILPKLGAQWFVNDETTIRSAVFRSISASTPASLYQTLEPTQVAGFNQIFDEFRQTRSWNFGLALDRQTSPKLQYGANAFYRDGETPFSITDARNLPPVTSVNDVESTEKRAELWLSWLPRTDLGVSAGYRYHDYETAENLNIQGLAGFAPDGVVSLTTHHVPIAVNYYHPSGWSTRLKVSYYDQRGRFVGNQLGVPPQDGDDSFWLADLAISYRLPKRRGMISFGVRNLLDETFRFEDRDSYDALGFTSSARPSNLSENRLFFAQVSLNFR